MKYQCENCENIHEKANLIQDCYECGNEVCNCCRSIGQDENSYCELCVEHADMEYSKNIINLKTEDIF